MTEHSAATGAGDLEKRLRDFVSFEARNGAEAVIDPDTVAEAADALRAKYAEIERLLTANYRQAQCINVTAQALGPETAATIDDLPKAAAHARAEIERLRAAIKNVSDRLDDMAYARGDEVIAGIARGLRYSSEHGQARSVEAQHSAATAAKRRTPWEPPPFACPSQRTSEGCGWPRCQCRKPSDSLATGAGDLEASTLKIAPAPALAFHDKGKTARLWFRDGVLDYEGELPPSEGARLFVKHTGNFFRELIAVETEKRLADALRAKDAEIERLTADRDYWKAAADNACVALYKTRAELAQARAEIERLRGALEEIIDTQSVAYDTFQAMIRHIKSLALAALKEQDQ